MKQYLERNIENNKVYMNLMYLRAKEKRFASVSPEIARKGVLPEDAIIHTGEITTINSPER